MHGKSPDAKLTAIRPDFAWGNATISPSRRVITGPHVTVSVEPRVMQVLLALIDADGMVVMREALINNCWSGRIVGDDAVNRAISEVRRLAKEADADSIVIETIAKSGWRLPKAEPEMKEAAVATNAPAATSTSRRQLIAGVVAGAAAIGGVQVWKGRQNPQAARVADLVERGTLALREDMPDRTMSALGFLKEAVAIDPQNAEAWGKLAMAWRDQSEYGNPQLIAPAVSNCQSCAKRALALDDHQPDAEAALATLVPIFGNWRDAEAGIRSVLARHPDNLDAGTALGALLMATGRQAASAQRHVTLAAKAPLWPALQFRAVYGHWVAGDLLAMDQVANRAMQLWPLHPGVWFARLWTFAFTGRIAAARVMIEPEVDGTIRMPPRIQAAILATLAGIERPTQETRQSAISANFALVKQLQGYAVPAILWLSGLGAIDSAFDVARGYLVGDGSIVGPPQPGRNQPQINDQRQKKTMNLFMPVTAPLRADPRFIDLARDTGMLAFWHEAGIVPDFLAGRGLPA